MILKTLFVRVIRVCVIVKTLCVRVIRVCVIVKYASDQLESSINGGGSSYSSSLINLTISAGISSLRLETLSRFRSSSEMSLVKLTSDLRR